MRKKIFRFSIWMVMATLLFTLAFQTARPVYADVATSPSELKVTSFSVTGGDTATGKIYIGNVVTVTLTILDTRISPTDQPSGGTASLSTVAFTPANTSVSIAGQTYVTGGTPGTSGLYYTVTFSGLTYTGTPDPFACNISYAGLTSPLPVANVSLKLNQLVKYIPPDPPDPGTPPASIPTGFILKDARYGDGNVYAGELFVLSLMILATNGSSTVDNVAVSFSPPEQLTIADGASVVYIGMMRPGTSTTVSAALMPGANIQEGSYTVAVDVNGVNPQNGDQVSSHMTVTIPVLQPERFEIFDAMLPTDLTAGVDDGMGYSTITLVNKGRGAVANVTVEIKGDGLYTDVGRQYLGNVVGGEQKMADFILHADTPGQIAAHVSVTYENVRGEQKTLEWPFTVNVNEAWDKDPGMEDPGFFLPEENIRTGPPLWVWILIIVAAAVVVTALLLRRRKKKKAAAEAALDFNDDDD